MDDEQGVENDDGAFEDLLDDLVYDALVAASGVPPGTAIVSKNFHSSPTEDSDEFDEWAALVAVTQDTRASIVADVVGHPEGAPSVPELNYTNPDVERPTIEEHLGTLVDAGVLRKEQLPPGERTRDLPYTFYRLTDAARDLFDRASIFDEDVWREQYARVEKPDDVVAAENAPRPGR